jgi:hypothetical protein
MTIQPFITRQKIKLEKKVTIKNHAKIISAQTDRQQGSNHADYFSF